MKKLIWLQTAQYLAKWNNYFSQLLNVHEVSDARQTDIHTAEPLVPETSVS